MIRTTPSPECPVCRQAGEPLYEGLGDTLFAADGRWSLRRCTADDCGTAWLDPRPVAEDLGKAYEQYYTHEAPATAAGTATARPPSLQKRLFLWLRRGYLASRFGLGQQRSGIGARLFGRLLRVHPDLAARVDLEAFHLEAPSGRFLEIGCGDGEHLGTMRELGWNVEGIDVDSSAVATTQSRGLPARCGALEDMDFAPESFDAIGMSHVIEHVDDPEKLLSACRELLAPGGRLVLITPNIASFGHARYGRHWLALDPPRHLRIYSSASLAAIVRDAGFASVATRTGVRDAHQQFLASQGIRKSGRWAWGTKGSFGARLGNRLLQLRARCGLVFWPQSGEEIILTAQK